MKLNLCSWLRFRIIVIKNTQTYRRTDELPVDGLDPNFYIPIIFGINDTYQISYILLVTFCSYYTHTHKHIQTDRLMDFRLTDLVQNLIHICYFGRCQISSLYLVALRNHVYKDGCGPKVDTELQFWCKKFIQNVIPLDRSVL